MISKKEWINMLEHQHKLYKMIDDKKYWYDNYIEWGERGNFIKLIYERRNTTEEKDEYILELENSLINIIKGIEL